MVCFSRLLLRGVKQSQTKIVWCQRLPLATGINKAEYSSCREVLVDKSQRNRKRKHPFKKLIDRDHFPPHLFLSWENDNDIRKHDFRSVLLHPMLSNANHFSPSSEKRKISLVTSTWLFPAEYPRYNTEKYPSYRVTKLSNMLKPIFMRHELDSWSQKKKTLRPWRAAGFLDLSRPLSATPNANNRNLLKS